MYVMCAIILLSISTFLGEGEFTQSVWPRPVMSQATQFNLIATRTATLSVIFMCLLFLFLRHTVTKEVGRSYTTSVEVLVWTL